MSREIDARGLACPQPVLATKRALEEIEEGIIKVIVDNGAARENIKRFAEPQGCSVIIEEKEGEFHIQAIKGDQEHCECRSQLAINKDVLLVGTDCLGEGEKELGKVLMKAFINTLEDSEFKPGKLIFINAGVRLTTEGSDVLDTLETLEKEGVEIFSCGTCLDYYHLEEKLKVGVVTNMYDTVNFLMEASKVVRI